MASRAKDNDEIIISIFRFDTFAFPIFFNSPSRGARRGFSALFALSSALTPGGFEETAQRKNVPVRFSFTVFPAKFRPTRPKSRANPYHLSTLVNDASERQ
jgi:hypothetical protein